MRHRDYTYNISDGIDARLGSLSLSGVEIGEFDARVTTYEGVAGEGVAETTVTSADGTRMRTYGVRFDAALAELALGAGWTAIASPGLDGAPVADVLPAGVVAVYAWDETAATWRGFFPGLDHAPGVNTLTAPRTGQMYWVAVEQPATRVVPAAAGVRP